MSPAVGIEERIDRYYEEMRAIEEKDELRMKYERKLVEEKLQEEIERLKRPLTRLEWMNM